MKELSEIGMNKTGIQASPIMSREAKENTELSPASAQGSTLEGIEKMRRDYNLSGASVGSVPIPATMKGVANAGLQALKGESPTTLVDKLGERLAFERTGVRLYDALISKCREVLPKEELERLEHFRSEEARHFAVVREAIESLGADPTAQTPSADINAVASQGIVQVLTDPRTTLDQCVQAILTAELVDNDGWELLVKLAKESGLDELASRFEEALEEELEHLDHVRRWNESLVLKHQVTPVQ